MPQVHWNKRVAEKLRLLQRLRQRGLVPHSDLAGVLEWVAANGASSAKSVQFDQVPRWHRADRSSAKLMTDLRNRDKRKFNARRSSFMPRPNIDPAVGFNDSATSEGSGPRALALMVEALELLDLQGGADIAGAHLDLAIHRLRQWIDKEHA
jgi:hypothetical protein